MKRKSTGVRLSVERLEDRDCPSANQAPVGTDAAGIDTDPTVRTLTFNVTWVNQAPEGADKTVTMLENTTYVLQAADFGFVDTNDSPANNFLAVLIGSSPSAGQLTDDGFPVT